jgi:hypothetical protein
VRPRLAWRERSRWGIYRFPWGTDVCFWKLRLFTFKNPGAGAP